MTSAEELMPIGERIFTAKREGYLTTYRQTGELLAKGELLCEIRDLQTFRVLQTVRAPFAGACPSIGPGSELRLVKVGEEVCTFKRVVGAEVWLVGKRIAEYRSRQTASLPPGSTQGTG